MRTKFIKKSITIRGDQQKKIDKIEDFNLSRFVQRQLDKKLRDS